MLKLEPVGKNSISNNFPDNGGYDISRMQYYLCYEFNTYNNEKTLNDCPRIAGRML